MATIQAKRQRSMRLQGNRLTITDERGRRERYLVEEIRDEEAGLLGVRLTKPDATTYDVSLAESSCECLGHLRWGCACKHLAAMKKLIDLGHVAR